MFANTDLTQAGNVIGSPAIVPRLEIGAHGIISHHLYAVRPNGHPPLPGLFLYHLLQEDGFKSHSKGHASGTTVLGFQADSALRYSFPLPPPDLTSAFQDVTGPIYRLVESYEERNVRLRLSRDLLLPRLVSGVIDVFDLPIDTGGLEP